MAERSKIDLEMTGYDELFMNDEERKECTMYYGSTHPVQQDGIQFSTPQVMFLQCHEA